MRRRSAEDNIRRGDADMIREDYEHAMQRIPHRRRRAARRARHGDRRKAAVKKFFDATIKLADQRITEGRYVDAETVLKVILRPEYDPGYEPAIKMLEHLEDPEYYNQTVTPEVHRQGPAGQGSASWTPRASTTAGRYDLAFKRYEQVLALDPYNDAARKGEERVDLAKRQARRSLQLRRNPRPPARRRRARAGTCPCASSGLTRTRAATARQVATTSGTAAIKRKLQRIIIPNIEFRSTTISDAIEYPAPGKPPPRHRPRPEQRGVNIFLKLPGAGGARPARRRRRPTDAGHPRPAARARTTGATGPGSAARPTANTRITLTLSRIPLLEALDYVASRRA